jgi:SAM-dependent methyltransferase
MDERLYDETYSAEDGHWWFLNLREILAASLRKHIKDPRNLTILDAGCGTGGNLLFYNAYGKVFGVDRSDIGLSFCRRRELKDLARADVCSLPFGDAGFDLVNSSDVLYAIEPGQALRFLEESYRVLKPGGYLFLNTAAMDILRSDHDRVGRTQKRYYKKELIQLLRNAEFELCLVRYWNGTLFLPVILYRGARKLLNAGKTDVSGDLRTPGRWLNRLLFGVMRIDWALAGRAPFGTSLFCVARKPGGPDPRNIDRAGNARPG